MITILINIQYFHQWPCDLILLSAYISSNPSHASLKMLDHWISVSTVAHCLFVILIRGPRIDG